MSERYTITVRAQLETVDLKAQIKKLEGDIASEAIGVTERKSQMASTNLKSMENQITRWNNSLREMESRDPDIFNVEEVGNARNEFVRLIDAFGKGEASIDDVNTSFDTLQAETRIATDQFRIGTEQTMDFAGALVHAAKKVFLWAGATHLIYGSLHAIRGGIDYIRELNKEMTIIRFVTGMTAEETGKLAGEYSRLAYQLGITTADIAKGAAEWHRAGYAAHEALQLKEASIRMGTLADIEAAQATNLLLSMINGFKLEIEEVMPAVDKLIQLDSELATSVEEMATAMQYSANSAQLAGISYDELASYIATVSSITRQSAQRIGNAFKSIFTRMQRVRAGFEFDEMGESINEVEQVLARHNVTLRDAVDQFRPMGDVLNEIAERWDDLTNAQQQQIAGAIAGYYQTENFITLMENYEDVLRAQDSAATAAGTTMERYGIYLEGIAAAQNKSVAAWERVWSATIHDDAIIFFHNLSGAVGTFIADIGGLQVALGTIIGLMVFFKGAAIANSIKLLGAKILGIATALKGATVAAITFQSALGGIGLAAALVMGGVAIYNYFFDLEKRIAKATEKMDELRHSIQQLDTSRLALPGLWEEMEELAEKTDRTAEETEKLYDLYTKVNSLVPGIAGHYNDLGQFIVDLNVPMETYIELLKEELRLKREIMGLQAEKEMDNLFKQYQKAIKEREKDLRLLEGVQRKVDLREMHKEGLLSFEEFNKAMQEVNKEFNFGIDVVRGYKLTHSSLAEAQLEVKESAHGITIATKDYITNFMLLPPLLQQSTLEMLEFEEGAEELYDTLAKLMGLRPSDSSVLGQWITQFGPQYQGFAEEVERASQFAVEGLISLNSELEKISESFNQLGELTPQDVLKLQELFPENYLDLLEWTGEKMLLNQEALRGLSVAKAEAALRAAEHAVALDETDDAAQRNLHIARALHAELMSGAGTYDTLTNSIISQTNDLYRLADAASKTIEEYEELGHMTPQMVAAFQSQFPLEFAQALEVVGGQVILNVDRLKELVTAHALAAVAAAEQALELDRLNVALQIAAQSAREFFNAVLSGEFWTRVPTVGGGGGGGSGTRKTPEEIVLEREMKSIQNIIKEIEKQIKAIQRRIREKQRNIRTIQETIKERQKEIDSIKDLQNVYQDLLKQYSEYISARKESLRLLKEEDDFAKRLADKNRSLARLKTDIALLGLDDSEEAVAQRLRLEEEAASLEENIVELKEDRKYDLQIRALDNLEKRYEEKINRQIELLDESIAKIQAEIDKYNEQIDLYRQQIQALNDIIQAHRDQIEVHREEIDVVREKIEAIKELTEAIRGGGTAWEDYGDEATSALDAIFTLLDDQYDELEEHEEKIKEIVQHWLDVEGNALKAYLAAKQYLDMIRHVGVGGVGLHLPVHWSHYTGQSNDEIRPHSGGLINQQGKLEYHGGGFAGGLKGNEVFAKLLKGEYVANTQQMSLFLNKILPKLITHSQRQAIASPNIHVEMPITVEGNMDSDTVPQIKNIADKVIDEINNAMVSRGYIRRSDQTIV